LCSIKDLAQSFNISYALAAQLTKEFKVDPDRLVQMRYKEKMREEKV
jgi:hypothetical protein